MVSHRITLFHDFNAYLYVNEQNIDIFYDYWLIIM